MNPEYANTRAREEAGSKLPSPGPGAVIALLRVGTRRCLLAAAVLVVVAGLVAQTAKGALAEAKGNVLYLDAPAVSTERATRAGEIARAFAGPGYAVTPKATPDVLAWLGLGPLRGGPAPPSQDARAAFASITAPDAEGASGITAEAAYAAGETMLAQIEDGAPPEEGNPKGGRSESELAAAGGAVRPELGDGTQAPKKHPSPDYEAPPAEQPTTPELASSPEPDVPAAGLPTERTAEPTGGEGLALEVPAPAPESAPAETEFAEAPTNDASLPPDVSPDGRPDYGATGPISQPAVETPAEPHAQPGTPADAGSGTEPSSEPPAEPPVPPAEDPEGGGEELAKARPTGTSRGAAIEAGANGSASPAPANAPPNGPPDGNPAPAAPDTGPTGGHGDDLTLVSAAPEDDANAELRAPAEVTPTSAPAPQEDLASASPAPEETNPSDGSGADVPERQLSGDLVQESGTSGGADTPVSPPADSSSWAGEAGDDPAEETAPPASDSPSIARSEEGEPGSSRVTDQPSPDTETASGETGSGETATPSLEEEAQTSAPGAAQATEPDADSGDEADLGDALTASSTPEKAPRKSAGEEAAQETSPDGNPHSPADTEGTTATDAPAPSPTGNAGIEDPLPEPEAPTGGDSDREPARRGDDHGEDAREDDDDWGERVVSGRSGTTGPGEWLEHIEDGTGGEEDVHKNTQEKVRRSTGVFGSRAEHYSVERAREEGSHGATNLEEAGERSFEGAWAKNHPAPTVETVPARLARQQRAWRAARREARLAKRRASLRADLRAQRRESRRAEIFAARVAQRKAERRANRLAARRMARQQAAGESDARPAPRAPAHANPAPACVPESVVATEADPVVRNQPAPARRRPVARSPGADLVPVLQVPTRRHVLVEKPPPVQLPPVRKVPAARLDPVPQVQHRQRSGAGGAGPLAPGAPTPTPPSPPAGPPAGRA